MKSLLLLIAITGALSAQTENWDDLSGVWDEVPAFWASVLVFVPSGVTLATLDPAGSVWLDTSVSPPVLKAAAGSQQAPVWIYNEAWPIPGPPAPVPDFLALAALPVPGTQMVYLNGVRQTPGLDYTIVGNLVTFKMSLQAGDTVLVDYRIL